jgi:DNA-binding XRE family transcriptional regulator
MKKNGERKVKKEEHYNFADYKKEIFKDPEVRERCELAFAELKLAHQIAELREKAHMTQAKLAVEIHTKQQVVSRLEDEHHIPSFTTLWKVANVFGKKLDIRFI